MQIVKIFQPYWNKRSQIQNNDDFCAFAIRKPLSGRFIALPCENLPVAGVGPTIIKFAQFNGVGGTTRRPAKPLCLQVLKIGFLLAVCINFVELVSLLSGIKEIDEGQICTVQK